ncbi:hypothetical protein IFM89_016002 [Coptis chinensis]|uniref:Uncharacterized protein n=1 Tax=Coptis chinensis TaxID=261450 RepID=A0A835ICA0_9MAGN|nr:hypothetical protein IFM89_016002 [Coptis chinensis]
MICRRCFITMNISFSLGTNVGDIAVWELGSRERLAHRKFKVWVIGTSSVPLQVKLSAENGSSQGHCDLLIVWHGVLMVPFLEKNFVSSSLCPSLLCFSPATCRFAEFIFSFEYINLMQIDAHIGSVCIVSCGDDKATKVWDAVTGVKQYTFEGHEAPVFSVCPHYKENIQFIFSMAMDGKIKAWLYDNLGSRVDYDAPGHCCTTMSYNADGTRVFSCGTSKEGDCYLVEWNESLAVKRTYQGFRKRSIGVVQFDTTKNRFLAVGDEFVIKIWDMENPNLMTTIEADGGLPASPRIRFNKEGMMLAVSTNDNGIKILANTDGLRLLHSFEAPRSASENVAKASTIGTLGGASVNPGTSLAVADRGAPVCSIIGLNGDNRSLADVKPRIVDESMEKSKIWKLSEINEPSQCRSLKLPDNLLPVRVSRLIYTNSGLAILALASNAVHKLWKWQRNERNPMGKASSIAPPQLWQPSSGILMTNETSEANPEDAVPCFALSKNDSYVMSASGGKISLFNMMTFKTMTTFMPPPLAATFLAFHPQDNNIIAIGMDDSSIQIYNVRVDEVKSKLKGHQKRVTGLTFSNVLNVLVSSGADAQLCVWSTDGWEKQASKFLQIPSGRVPASLAETRVQFHQDQIQFLTVHETQIAIYEASKLECLKQTFSLIKSQFLYHVGSSNNSRMYPLVIAAHPTEPNQFALGLTDGAVHVLEPLESEGKWGSLPPSDNGAGSSIAAGQGSSDQPTR